MFLLFFFSLIWIAFALCTTCIVPLYSLTITYSTETDFRISQTREFFDNSRTQFVIGNRTSFYAFIFTVRRSCAIFADVFILILNIYSNYTSRKTSNHISHTFACIMPSDIENFLFSTSAFWFLREKFTYAWCVVVPCRAAPHEHWAHDRLKYTIHWNRTWSHISW